MLKQQDKQSLTYFPAARRGGEEMVVTQNFRPVNFMVLLRRSSRV